MSGLISIQSLLQRGNRFVSRACDLTGSHAMKWSMCMPYQMLVLNNNTCYNRDDLICDERRLGGVRGAKKKAGGSSTNGRNSIGRRLGIKVWPNKFAKAGNIIIRQRGNLFRAGTNVGVGKDHTLFAKADGMVSMTRLETNKKRNVVHVLPPSTQMHFDIIAKRGIDPETLSATP